MNSDIIKGKVPDYKCDCGGDVTYTHTKPNIHDEYWDMKCTKCGNGRGIRGHSDFSGI